MSGTTRPITHQPSTHSESTSSQSVQVPAFLETAGKATKIIAGIIFAIIAAGCTSIGITLAPFAPEIGPGAIALGTGLFAIAGYLIYSGATPSAPNLNSRNITEEAQRE
jgi:hypothetical protein